MQLDASVYAWAFYTFLISSKTQIRFFIYYVVFSTNVFVIHLHESFNNTSQ